MVFLGKGLAAVLLLPQDFGVVLSDEGPGFEPERIVFRRKVEVHVGAP